MVYCGGKETKTMKPLKNKVSITLDQDVIERIREMADEDDRSFSQYINIVLRKHMAASEQKKEKQ